MESPEIAQQAALSQTQSRRLVSNRAAKEVVFCISSEYSSFAY